MNVTIPPGEIDKESTTYTRELENERMTAIYAKARELGRTFEQQAECEFAEMLYWRLGPLSDPTRFRGDLARKALIWEQEAKAGVVDVTVGSAYGLASSMAERRIQIDHLVGRYPKIAADVEAFLGSAVLRNMPSLRYPALLRAGLVLTPKRKAKRGDGFDLSHLMKGLSRCDIVTADGGMTQMVSGFKLTPDGVSLFRSADRKGFQSSIEDHLSAS